MSVMDGVATEEGFTPPPGNDRLPYSLRASGASDV